VFWDHGKEETVLAKDYVENVEGASPLD